MYIMSEKITFTENDLYKSLKKHDADILKHFNDSNLSDQEYLFYAINSDIMSNALGVLINMMSGNIESVGVDNNCRGIIEAFVILKMIALGDISDNQAEIFRYQYSLVDLDNYKKLLSDEDKKHPNYANLINDRAKAMNALSKHFNLSVSQIRKKYSNVLDDPNLYLKHSPNDRINFAHLLEEYPINDDCGYAKMYELFSIFAHPRYEENSNIENGILNLRQVYIDKVMEYVFQYLLNSKLIIKDDSLPGFKEDFLINPVLKNNIENIKTTEMAFGFLEEYICKFDKGYDAFTFDYLEKMKHLIIDMMISVSLGYKEQVVSKFKSFIEYTSIYICVNMVEDLNEFKNLKYGYLYSSRLQIEEHIKGVIPNGGGAVDVTPLKALFDVFYGPRYGLNDYAQFEKRIRGNSLYFLDKYAKAYNRFVTTALNQLFLGDEEKHVLALYKASKDMNHASGYNFNSSEGIWDSSCWKTLIIVWKCMIQLTIRASLILEEHGIKRNVDVIVKQFTLFLKVVEDELKKVVESYQ